jgi:hypothetical protein
MATEIPRSEFKATPAMRRCKSLLAKSCPEKQLLSLTPEDSLLVKYIAPTPLPLLRKWIKDSIDFWPWLLTPVESGGDLLRAKELAYSHLVEILELPIVNCDGQIDYELLKSKQQAVNLILTKDKPMISVSNHNSSQTAVLPSGDVPRGLRGKSSAMLESKIAALAEATDTTGVVLEALHREDEL